MTKKNIDYVTLLLVIGLVLFGILMVFSTSYYAAEVRKPGTGFDQLTKQLMYAGIGTVVMIGLAMLPYKVYRVRVRGIPVLLWLAYLGSMAMLVLVLVPGIGVNLNGANRWLKIAGVTIQPSEIARFAMILCASDYLARHYRKLQSMFPFKPFLRWIVPVGMIGAVVCMGILLGRSLSMTVCAGLVFFVLLFVAGVDRRFLLGFLLLMVAAGAIAIAIEPFRMARIAILLDPWKDPLGDGYQVIQGLYALGAGGLVGKGLGNGTQKLLYLTYGDSDFILANIGEELGFVGIVLLMAVFMLLIWRGLWIALHTPDMFGRLLAVGITSLIAVQVILHVAVVSCTFPPTGIPLPFISAGGTSLIMFMGEVGILLNISRYRTRA